MNSDNKIFTAEELDALSKAYLDCRLTKLEEKELELVLLSCDASSPIIDEARETMGIMAAYEKATPQRHKHSYKTSRFTRAAAAIGIIMMMSLAIAPFLKDDGSNEDRTDSFAVAVYIDGERLSPEKAVSKAEETQAMCMAMLEQAVDKATTLQNENTKILNRIIE